MKLTIFGATGRTGQLLVKQALEAGRELTLLVFMFETQLQSLCRIKT